MRLPRHVSPFRLPFLGLLALLGSFVYATDDHLLICEAVLTPTTDEYIEIVNPTGAPVALDDYYLSDDADYALLPGASGDGPAPDISDFDFIAQFPPGSSIPAGGVIVVAFDGAAFATAFGSSADFEILATDAGTPDMVATDVGPSAGLTNGGEMAVLFTWDGASDLVQDVDLVKLGTPSSSNDIPDKSAISVDGPDGDSVASTYAAEAATMPQQLGDPGSGFSTKRISLEGWAEIAGGNGLTGDDESSEDIQVTWDSGDTAPDPGTCGPLALPVQDILINEVDADTAGTDTLEFIELYAAPNLSLDGLVVVLYNGNGDVSYAAYDLDGYTTNAEGFFVLGNSGVTNVDLVLPNPDNNVQNGADAVAIYQGDDTDFPGGTAVTDANLIDALVYDTNDGDDSGLIDVLTPGQAQINEDELGDKDNHANARVPDGGTAQDTSTYTQQLPTPGTSNLSLAPPDVVINEVDADQTGTDTGEFVELYGEPNLSLDGLVLVLYNGNGDVSYAAYDLDGHSLDGSGFFVIGNAGVPNVGLTFPNPDNNLQNGADAVALYQGDDTDFPNATPVTATNLLDALVYGTDDPTDTGLVDVLTPGQVQVDEDGDGSKDTHSNSRVPDGGTPLDTSTYLQQDPTPGTSNALAGLPEVVINEVDADQAGTDTDEFIELYGAPNLALDGLVLVLINGNGDTSYAAYDLDGQTLDADGFWLIGSGTVPGTDMTFPDPDNNVQNGADAVAIYEGNAADWPSGTPATATNLIDALVYDTNDSDDTVLIDILTPGQAQINEGGMGDQSGHSNSRVPNGGTPRDTSTYTQQAPTPGSTNTPLPNVVINEVDADTAGTDTLEFVELFGDANASLDGLVLVLYNGNGDSSYAAYDLDGQSLDANGFFVIGNTGVANTDMTFPNPDNNVQNGADAVALYEGDATDFPSSTAVTADNLIDALVYDTNDGDDSGLIDVLTPGQAQINEDELGDKDAHSNSRVPDGGTGRDTSTYTQQAPTPGESNVPAVILTIAEIQGDGAASPYEGQVVTTTGNIVTVLNEDGFFMQDPGVTLDGDDATSEGIFVFTDAVVAVGDAVEVSGEIVEYFGLTEFGNSPTVNVLSSGNALPAAVVLTAADTPTTAAELPFIERYEGMLVSFANGLASGPTNQFGDTPFVLNGILAFREPGIQYPGEAGLPVWDGNPEVLNVNAEGGATPVNVRRGATVSGEGALTYSFGQYNIHASSLSAANNDMNPTAVRDRAAGEFTVASQNMHRLLATEPDYADRLTKHSLLVRTILGAPDVLAVQEVNSITELTDLATRIQTDDPSINYTAYLQEGNDPGGIDNGYLVRNTISVTQVYQVQADETFPFEGFDYWLHDRPPLVLEGMYGGTPSLEGDAKKLGGGTEFVVMNIHNRSLLGLDDPTSGEFRRTKRNLQGTRISDEVQAMQTANSDINLIVLGDFNAFEFTDGYVDVTGQISGNLDPLGAMIPGTDVVNPDLTNVLLGLDANQRYSFIEDGTAQLLDQVLSSTSANCIVTDVQFGRANADFPRALESDPSTVLRASDHDGAVIYLSSPGITVTPIAGLLTSEDGSSDSFTVVLNSQPASSVVVPLISDNINEGIVSPSQLTFDTGNWNVPQTVTVTGVADNTIDADTNYNIVVGPATGDDCYAGMDPEDVEVTNLNIDSSGDYTLHITIGDFIHVTGTPNGLVGLYKLGPDGEWIFLENVQLDAAGSGTSSTVAEPDMTYGVGGPDGLIPPTTGFATVPTLGEWAMLAMIFLMMAAAVAVNRRRKV